MSKKYTRLELLQIRYATVRNATGDTVLARKASQWSNARIEREIGVTVRNYPLRPIEETKRAQRKYLNYKRYIEAGYEVEQARKLKVKRFEKLEDVVLKKRVKRYGKKTDTDRKEQWRYWVSHFIEVDGKKINLIPQEIKDLASQINHIALDRYGTDDNARYGYAVAYYAFVRQMSIADVMDVIRPERFSGDIYRYNKRI